MTTLTEITEGTTPIYTATLKNETGVVVPATTLTAARLTYYSIHTGAIVNGRVGQNILNVALNNVTISAVGVLVWKLQEADTILIDAPKPTLGLYRAVFVFEWLDAGTVERQVVHEVAFQIKRAINAPFAV